jgi:hypothetical protein
VPLSKAVEVALWRDDRTCVDWEAGDQIELTFFKDFSWPGMDPVPNRGGAVLSGEFSGVHECGGVLIPMLRSGIPFPLRPAICVNRSLQSRERAKPPNLRKRFVW